MFGAVECPEVQPLDRAVDGLAAVDPDTLGDAHLAEAVVEVRRVAARLAAVEARLVAAVDARRTWAASGYRGTAAWLADSDNTARGDAQATVRLARRLHTMPTTAAALAAGDITTAHAHRLAALAAPSTAAAFARAEPTLVGQARTLRWADFAKAAAYWARAARDDGPDPDRADRDHRHVAIHDGLRGTGLLTGELTPVAKATIREALHRIERELFESDWAAARSVHGDATTTAHLARTPRQRRHDALVEMAVRASTAPGDGKRPRPLVSVLTGHDTFRNVCELADGTLLSPATVAGLLDEAVIERIVFDGPSRVIDVGHARRFTGAARRAVEVRDRHCTGPGCDVPARHCDIDHIWRHSDGGPTHPDNGQALCGFHNRRREPTTGPRGRPPPPTDGSAADHPSGPPSHVDGLARLELLRARIRDRLRHDPRWAA